MSARDIFKRPESPPTHWNERQLDDLRQVTDEPADAIVAEFFSGARSTGDGSISEPHELLMSIMDHRIAEPLQSEGVSVPQQLLNELAARCPLPAVESAEVQKGQVLFQNHGPEMLLALCCYSLPMAYGAANGAHVLHETGYLENRVTRRLVETTQMVVDVMKPGGLDPGGDGLRTAHEVRLMHASVRYLIAHGDRNWDVDKLGQPINQEDLAGTLMTFSYVVLDGLSKMGIHIDSDAQESYLAAWRNIGRTMGLHEELLPRDMAEAQELTWFIHDRQMHGSEVGIDLTQALLKTMESHVPGFAKDCCPAMVRMFMEPHMADALKVPRHLLLDHATWLMNQVFGAVDSVLSLDPLGLRPYRWLSMLVIKAVTYMGRGHDRRANFELPSSLHEYWKVPPAHRTD